MFTYKYEAKICPVCKKVYMPTGYAQKYCPDCKPSPNKPRDKKCEWCGSMFHDDSRNNTYRYCSDRCRKAVKSQNTMNWLSRKAMEEVFG